MKLFNFAVDDKRRSSRLPFWPRNNLILVNVLNVLSRLYSSGKISRISREYSLSFKGKESRGGSGIVVRLFGGGKSEWWLRRVGRMVWGTTVSREGKTRLAVVAVMVVVV